MVHRLVADQVQLNETIVKDLHQQLLEGMMPGGVYRTRDLFILGAKHVPPTYLKIYQKMSQFYADLNDPELKGLKKRPSPIFRFLKSIPLWMRTEDWRGFYKLPEREPRILASIGFQGAT